MMRGNRRGGAMRKLLAISVLMLSMVGLNALPASAHIEVGVNCHMNQAVQRSGERVHIEIRISNRTQFTQRSGCQVKIITTTHFRKDWSIRTFPPRTFRIVRYTVHIPGQFTRWVITHGHTF
jgi:hypothetical protein